MWTLLKIAGWFAMLLFVLWLTETEKVVPAFFGD